MSDIAERIAEMRVLLETDDGKRDAGLIAYMVRDWPETVEFELDDLAHMLHTGEYGCSVNDVIGLLDYVEGRAFPNGKDEDNAKVLDLD